MTFRSKIEGHLPYFFISAIVTGFIGGWVAHARWRSDGGYVNVKEGSYYYRDEAIRRTEHDSAIRALIAERDANWLKISDLPEAFRGPSDYARSKIQILFDGQHFDQNIYHSYAVLASGMAERKLLFLNRNPTTERCKVLHHHAHMLFRVLNSASSTPIDDALPLGEQVKLFQRRCNLSKIDGIMGPETWKVVSDAYMLIVSNSDGSWHEVLREQLWGKHH